MKVIQSSSQVKVIRSNIMVGCERSCHKEYTCEILKPYLSWRTNNKECAMISWFAIIAAVQTTFWSHQFVFQQETTKDDIAGSQNFNTKVKLVNRRTDGRTTPIHRPQLLCNPANKSSHKSRFPMNLHYRVATDSNEWKSSFKHILRNITQYIINYQLNDNAMSIDTSTSIQCDCHDFRRATLQSKPGKFASLSRNLRCHWSRWQFYTS